MSKSIIAILKRLRQFIGYFVILVTIAVFALYIRSHREVIDQLKSTDIVTIILIVLLYGMMTGLLAVLYKVMTDICKINVPPKENLLLTMYSSVVNFFGPLQSGPGFRMVYLKRKYKINLASYIGVSLLYYLFFGVFSGLMLISGLFGYYTLAFLVVLPVVAYFMLPTILLHPVVRKRIPTLLPWKSLGILAGLSLVQVLLVSLIYFAEISSIQAGVNFGQALVYTGAANFALFVSLTPGALGFRESFLYFSKSLHGIDQATIVSANIIDRGVYLLFLGLLFLIIIAMHGRKKFGSTKVPSL